MSDRKLGRGLSDLGLTELLSEVNTPVATTPAVTTTPVAEATPTMESNIPATKLTQLPIEKLKPGRYQPRKEFDKEALQELANSIKSQGIIQPIVVRNMNDGYEIIAGERRWRAAQLIGMDQIPAIIKDIPDQTAIAMSLIENIQRKDLNALEEANALQRLIDEFNLTHQEVATAVGKSRTLVTNLLRLQKLNNDVKQMLLQGDLEMGHARALLALDGEQQSQVAKMIAERALSVRQTEALIRNVLDNVPEEKQKPVMDPDIARLQNDLSEKLSAKVAIQHKQTGKGKLVIHYNSVDELDGILEYIQ